MTELLRITDIRFHPASRENRVRGLLGWASIEIGDLRIDGIAVRKTLDGRLALSFPERTDAGGNRRPTARPLDTGALANIEKQVFGTLRQRGWLQ